MVYGHPGKSKEEMERVVHILNTSARRDDSTMFSNVKRTPEQIAANRAARDEIIAARKAAQKDSSNQNEYDVVVTNTVETTVEYDLNDIPTNVLVEELSNWRGVDRIDVEPHHTFHMVSNGPSILLNIYD